MLYTGRMARMWMNTEFKKDLKPTTFRLTLEARRLLKLLSQAKGISMAAVLEGLIRKEAKEENV
jgi:hypothetical protein